MVSFQHCITGGGGSKCYFGSEKRTGVENSYLCMGVPRTFGRPCSCTYNNKIDKKILWE